MINIPQAIHKLYPQATCIVGFDNPIAYDVDGNEVDYDLEAVTAEAQAAAQAIIDARQSALNKLMALGLTEEEALALGVK
jgi:hypothetical protein